MRWNATSPHPLAPLSDCLDPPPPPLGLGVADDPPLGLGAALDPPLGAGLGLGGAVDPLVAAAVDPLVVAALDSPPLSKLLPLQFGQHLLFTSPHVFQGFAQCGWQGGNVTVFGWSLQNGKQGARFGFSFCFSSAWYHSASSQHSSAQSPS